MCERWQMSGLALMQLPTGEGRIILCPQRSKQGMPRPTRLDQDLPGMFGPPGPARDLKQRGKQALGCPKIMGVQATVGTQDHDQGQAWKIMPLGHHLGSDQNIDLTRANRRQQRLGRAATARGVAVNPHDSCGRKAGCNALLEPLRPPTQRRQVNLTARGAGPRHRIRMPAVMAD